MEDELKAMEDDKQQKYSQSYFKNESQSAWGHECVWAWEVPHVHV